MGKEAIEEAEKAFVEALKKRKDGLLAEVREADKEGDRRYGRITSLQGEADDLQARVSALEAERERLPMQAYRAGLDEVYEEEDSLKERYRVAGEELTKARERAGEVAAELSRHLVSNQGHENDAVISAFRESVAFARAARTELEELRDRLTRALEENLEPVVRAHENARGPMWAWNVERSVALAEKAAFGRSNAEAARQIQEREERDRLRARQKAV